MPGIIEMLPATGHKNRAPLYSSTSRTGRRQPVGTPFFVGSWDRERCVLTIMVQKSAYLGSLSNRAAFSAASGDQSTPSAP